MKLFKERKYLGEKFICIYVIECKLFIIKTFILRYLLFDFYDENYIIYLFKLYL